MYTSTYNYSEKEEQPEHGYTKIPDIAKCIQNHISYTVRSETQPTDQIHIATCRHKISLAPSSAIQQEYKNETSTESYQGSCICNYPSQHNTT